MKRQIFLWPALFLLLAGCGQLDTIPYSPPQTPASWLTIQPYARLNLLGQEVILAQPMSTSFVYALGVLAIAIGQHAWRSWQRQQSRRWWGVALLLWGAGALLAGTSYEGLSYHLKCAGREVCLWTTWWELAYLILSAASINAMLLAQAYGCAQGNWRRVMVGYALAHTTLYAGAVLLGAFIPHKFLISFEFLILTTGPTILFFTFFNGWRYARFRQKLDLLLLGTWLGLGVVIGLYFLYYALGFTAQLWAQGIWFSDNDVLHLGLIAWMVYIARGVLPRMRDAAPEGIAA